jgi:hypothetical protein
MVVESVGTLHPGDVEFGQMPICSDLDPNDGDGKAFLNLEITLETDCVCINAELQSKPEILTNVIYNSDTKCQLQSAPR